MATPTLFPTLPRWIAWSLYGIAGVILCGIVVTWIQSRRPDRKTMIWLSVSGVLLLGALITGWVGVRRIWKPASEIVLKIEPVALPIEQGNDFLYSMEVRGRFPSHIGKSYGPADKRSRFWPSENMPHPSPAIRYTLINRSQSILYNVKLALEITHDEAVAIQHGFSHGNSVYRFSSGVTVDELLPSPEGKFVFYLRNLSEDFVYVIPADYVTTGSGQKMRIKTLGPLLPLEHPRVYEKK